MSKHAFISLNFPEKEADEMLEAARSFHAAMEQRRTVRDFSSREVSKEIIEEAIMTASSAPSGAHKQPWLFCAVQDNEIKSKIREAAEEEEYQNYNGRMSDEWLEDLAPLETDWKKPFLEIAPWLIIVFKKPYDLVDGERKINYYVNESVGIACGLLLAALHKSGLATLTHTPSPMNFLQDILERPSNEKPYLLIPVGYPAEGAEVPDFKRKGPEDVIEWY
jgi:nitroreductase